MSLSRTSLRLITVLFLLAGILLLRKPVFGQAITAAPTRFSLVSQGVAPGEGAHVILIPGLSSSSPQIRVPHPFALLPRQGEAIAPAGTNRIAACQPPNSLTTLDKK
jgi:hypothetical protein